MSARDAVLSRIRKSLGAPAGDPGRHAVVISRLENPTRGVIPARGQLPTEERVTLFSAMAQKVSASVSRIAADDALPEAVAAFLRDANLPAAIRMGNDPKLRGLPWYRVPQISLAHGPSDGSDAVTLSHAVAGVAETGTLVLASGSDNPTTLNFLPETHIVAVRAADIAGDYESVWTVIRDRYGKGEMPRTVNMITGPSRSADIEQTLLLGAHGPRRLHIVIIG